MKKYLITIVAAGMFACTTVSCNDGEHNNMDQEDTTTVPAETTVPVTTPDTATAPPVDPAMDTSASQTPKM